MQELQTILSNEAILAMIIAPGMVIGLTILVMAYKLLSSLGKVFISILDRQTTALEQIAHGIKVVENSQGEQKLKNEDIRITLNVLSEKIDQLKNDRRIL